MNKLAWLGLCLASQLWAADPRVGSWKLISAQSVLDPPSQLIITAQGQATHVVISGSGVHTEFSAKPDGHDYPVQNILAFNQIAIHQVDRHTAEITEKKDGVLVASVLEKVSKGNMELVIYTRRKGHPEEIQVLRRGPGGKRSANPFVGEWTQDVSESRMRQGLLVKIETVGNGQVHFAGEFSYTAKLDGKDYTLKDSPNDTVAITQKDAHTVDSTYKRGDETVETDRWTLSADGSQITVTRSGVIVGGQHIKETLVLARQ